MKTQIILSIEPHEDGEHCGKCVQSSSPRTGNTDVMECPWGRGKPRMKRHFRCLAAEAQMRALVEAAQNMLNIRGITVADVNRLHAALAALEAGR